MNKRQLTLSIFSDWRKENYFIDHLLEARLFQQPIEEKDKKWIQFILYGSIESFYSLDHVLKKMTNNKFNKNKQIIRNILYLATYELLYSKGKHYAIINEYVQLTKLNKKIYEAKIVNGVLREISKQKDSIIHDLQNSNDIQIKYNISNILHSLLLKEYTSDQLINWYKTFKNKSFWVRHNSLKVKSDNRFQQTDSFEEIKDDLQKGRLSIQDISAGKVVEYMNPKAKTKILDYCSAPGGKACYIAEFTNDQADVTATDSDDFRLTKVKENVDRLGIKNVKIKPIDELVDLKFDQVLVDIPCSGIGVLSRRKDMSLLFKSEKLKELEELQKSILNRVTNFVKPDGELIISTCTILKKENYELVKNFIAEHPEFIEIESPLICLPFNGKHDGSFAAKLKRIK